MARVGQTDGLCERCCLDPGRGKRHEAAPRRLENVLDTT